MWTDVASLKEKDENIIKFIIGLVNNLVVEDDMRILTDDIVTVNSNSVIELSKLLLLLGIITVVDITISR